MAAAQPRTATLVGLFIFIGLVVLAWLILLVGRFENRYEETYTIRVELADASGVVKGTPVKLAGVRIGSVVGPPRLHSVSPPRVIVPVGIDSSRNLPVDARFRVQSATVLGDKLLTVTIPPSPAARNLKDGDLVEGGGQAGLEAITNDALAVVHETRTLVTEAQSSLQSFDSAVGEIRGVTRRLGETVDTVNRELLNEANIRSISFTISHVEDASLGIRNASAEFQPVLAAVREAVNRVSALAQTAENTFSEIDQQLTQVGPAIEEVPATMRSLRRAADQAGEAVVQAEKTFAKAGDTLDTLTGEEGLVGALTQDAEVSTDTKSFIRNLRRHGILGYKDEETPADDPRERYQGRRR
ncbi:MlaD family protein [Roseibacillus ishigakijimensis]|uniref:MCE family protein n=2 Tax=Roseibacillus ishigakijimensis TaxID=454146 RepID=A0A934RMT4_9BACT|nr:MCE family protein [Roseibacillus ishigakijimensis]